MVDWLAAVVIGASLLLAAYCGWTGLRNRPTNDPHLYSGGVVEAVLLVQVFVAVAQLLGGERPEDMATFISYLLLVPFVLPIGFLLSLVERTRWGSLILGAACLVLAVLVVRLQDIWDVRG